MMDQMASTKMAAADIYETKADRKAGQVSIAMSQLDEAIQRLDLMSEHLLTACGQVMQPENTGDAMARLDSVPREPVAPLALRIEECVARVGRITDAIQSGYERTQL